MKRTICITALVLLVPYLKAQDTKGIITSDIDLFWECYDAAKPNFEAKHFERYLEEGSKGVKGFINYRIESAKKLANTVRKEQTYYEHIRTSSLQIKSAFTDQIKKVYQSMRDWYPETVIPDAYFVIGRLNTGGTISKDGLIMGAEMFGPQNEKDAIKARIDFQVIPGIVAHELIHFQQNYPNSKTLLDQTIREGSADFVAYLIQNNSLVHHLDDWAVPKSQMLWSEFKTIMQDKNYHGWLYGGRRKKDRPADLGYWMGFHITKAYFQKQKDPKQALADILNIRDFNQFLEESGFDGRIMKDYSGLWRYEVKDTGDGTYTGIMDLRYSPDGYTGKMKSEGGEWPIKVVEFDDDRILFTTTAEGFDSKITGSFEGKEFVGSVAVDGDDQVYIIRAKRQ